jgi:hypothetical protein
MGLPPLAEYLGQTFHRRGHYSTRRPDGPAKPYLGLRPNPRGDCPNVVRLALLHQGKGIIQGFHQVIDML